MTISRCGIILLLLYNLTGCYESVEDCLDVDAVNYSVEADSDCESCCQLPDLDLIFSFLNNGVSITTNPDVVLASGETVTITDFHFYLTGIHLNLESEETVVYEDSVRIFIGGEDIVYVQNDFRYFDRSRFKGTLEGIRKVGAVKDVEFQLGIEEIVNSYNIDSIEANSGLSSTASDAYDANSGFVFLQLSVSNDIFAQDLELKNAYPLLEIQIPLLDISLLQGKNTDVTLNFDFSLLLDGFSINSTSSENLQTLIDNFSSAISQKK